MRARLVLALVGLVVLAGCQGQPLPAHQDASMSSASVEVDEVVAECETVVEMFGRYRREVVFGTVTPAPSESGASDIVLRVDNTSEDCHLVLPVNTEDLWWQDAATGNFGPVNAERMRGRRLVIFSGVIGESKDVYAHVFRALLVTIPSDAMWVVSPFSFADVLRDKGKEPLLFENADGAMWRVPSDRLAFSPAISFGFPPSPLACEGPLSVAVIWGVEKRKESEVVPDLTSDADGSLRQVGWSEITNCVTIGAGGGFFIY